MVKTTTITKTTRRNAVNNVSNLLTQTQTQIEQGKK